MGPPQRAKTVGRPSYLRPKSCMELSKKIFGNRDVDGFKRMKTEQNVQKIKRNFSY